MLFLLLAIPLLPAPDQVELSAKPGGKVTIEYGSPTWRDEFANQLSPGETWRLGANGATTLTTTAGLVFDDVVLLPGEYNLGASPKSSGEWDLVFHHDGIQYRGETTEGRARLTEVEVGKSDFGKRLRIELDRDKSAPKGEYAYLFQATFGPKKMQGRFLAPKAKSAKAKAGDAKCELTWLAREDQERVVDQLSGGGLLVASIAVTGQDDPIRVHLEGGTSPSLRLFRSGKPAAGRSIGGQLGELDRPVKALEVEVRGGDDLNLEFRVDTTSYHFAVPPDALEAP